MNVLKLKEEYKISMLRGICQQISELGDDWLKDNADGLLSAIVDVLDSQSQDDVWGTEGWEHFFGYEDK